MRNTVNQNYSNFETKDENDLGYGQLFAKLWRRRFWFAGVFTAVMTISIPMAMTKPPVYQSYIQILVEPNYQKGSSGGADNEYLEREFTDPTIQVDYATQLRVFKSAKILNKVARKLVVENSDGENLEEQISAIAEYLKQSLSVYQIIGEDGKTQTKIIQANYIAGDPVETKRVLETIQEVYLEYNLEQQRKRLRDGLDFVNAQIPKAQMELLQAEAAVTELSKQHNLISPEADANAIKAELRQIAQQRNELKAQQSEIEANYNSLQQQLELPTENSVVLSRLSQSPRYQNLLNKLQEIEILLATERQRFTDANPTIQNLIDQRDSQRALLIAEAEKILGELPPDFVTNLESLSKQGQLVRSDTNFIDKITESQSNLTGIRQRDSTLAETEAELKQKLAQFPELIAQYKSLVQQAEIKRQALQKLLEAKQELEIELNRGGFNWQVIEPAQIGMQIAPNLQKDLMLSVVVASFLGLAAAFIREALDRRIDNVEEIEKQISLPILGTTPQRPSSSSKNILGQLPLLANHTTSIREIIQWQPFREALDIVYENLKLSSINSDLKSLAVTSSIAGEGKSTFIMGLALSVARHKQKVLIIDADFRCSSLHRSLELSNNSGLADYLAGDIDSPEIKQVTFLGETVDLITSGTKPADPVKLLGSPKLRSLIEQQKQNYDLILVDTPPVDGMVDAVKVASICDNTVIVTRLDKVEVSDLLETTALLSNLNVLGIVANSSQRTGRQSKAQSQYLLY